MLLIFVAILGATQELNINIKGYYMENVIVMNHGIDDGFNIPLNKLLSAARSICQRGVRGEGDLGVLGAYLDAAICEDEDGVPLIEQDDAVYQHSAKLAFKSLSTMVKEGKSIAVGKLASKCHAFIHMHEHILHLMLLEDMGIDTEMLTSRK